MRENYYSIDRILADATAEQKVLWNEILLLTGGNCSIRPLYLYGQFSAMESSVFIARRIYFAYSIVRFSYSASNATLFPVNIFDIIGNSLTNLWDGTTYWNTTAAAPYYADNHFKITNIIYGRITANAVIYGQIIGWRIIY